MNENEVLKIVEELIRENFDDDSLEITRETVASDVEDWDSLEQINLLTAMGKKFNITFSLADVRNLENVGDMVDLIIRLSK